MIVTAITPQKKGGNRLDVFVDGKFALHITAGIFEKSGIHVGQELTPSELETLRQSEQTGSSLERAHRYLAARPRSEMEVRLRLKRYGYTDTVIDLTLDRLRESELIDDAAFADFWRENRTRFNPRSARLVAGELRGKGIKAETITEIIDPIDDEVEAYRAGYKKAGSLPTGDYNSFRRKLEAYLRRRGFDYAVINGTINRLWQEKRSGGTNG